MNQTTSYTIEILGNNKNIFRGITRQYRDAVSFMVTCFDKEWSSIQLLSQVQRKKLY